MYIRHNRKYILGAPSILDNTITVPFPSSVSSKEEGQHRAGCTIYDQ
jgi:hypothetical protein